MWINFTDAFKSIQDKISGWTIDLVTMLPNALVALVIVILFAILSRLVRKGVNKTLSRFSHQTALNRLIANLSNLLVISIGILLALSALNMEGVISTALAGAGIIGIALGFAFQEITANFFSGIILAVRQPFRVGSWLETNGHYGVATHIDLWTTIIRNPQGQQVIIPNKDVLQNILINYSRGRRRIDLNVGVSYGDDLSKVKSVVLDTLSHHPQKVEGSEIEFYYQEFGSSSINFTVMFWINFKKEGDYLSAKSEAIIRLKSAFDGAGVTIPFPITTLDFGIKGGEKLSSMLTESPGPYLRG